MNITVPRTTSMTLARRHWRGPSEPISGLPPNGGFGRSLEDVSYGPYVNEPSRQVHVVATKSSTGNRNPATVGNLAASEPVHRSRFGAENLRLAASIRVAHYPYSPRINYTPQFVFRQQAQAVLGHKFIRNILLTLDLHLHPITSKNVLSR